MKQSGSESDHSPPSSDGIKNVWSFISTLWCIFMRRSFIKHWANFSYIVYLSCLCSMCRHRQTRVQYPRSLKSVDWGHVFLNHWWHISLKSRHLFSQELQHNTNRWNNCWSDICYHSWLHSFVILDSKCLWWLLTNDCCLVEQVHQ
jgi:hypothetical protein